MGARLKLQELLLWCGGGDGGSSLCLGRAPSKPPWCVSFTATPQPPLLSAAPTGDPDTPFRAASARPNNNNKVKYSSARPGSARRGRAAADSAAGGPRRRGGRLRGHKGPRPEPAPASPRCEVPPAA